MKKILTLLCVLSCLISFSQTSDKSKRTSEVVTFIVKLDTAEAQKNGFALNGYIVNIDYDRARELHGKKIKITGKVTVVKGVKNDPYPGFRAGWQEDTKYIASPKIKIIEG